MLATRFALPLALVLALAANAAADDVFRLEGATLPRPLIRGEANDVEIEASGVEPIGDGRRVLVAHDKTSPLIVVDLATGRIVGEPLASPRFPGTTKLGGPKWEGMARDSESNFYLVGSHSGKTDEEKAEKAVLIRFRLKESDEPAIDDASIVRWRIARSLEAAVKASPGVDGAKLARRKIEGLAIRESRTSEGKARRELVVGLREPGDLVRAFVADVTAAPGPDAELELKPLFSFDAGAREGVQSQLTSLEYAPALGGFLVATASEDAANAFHGNTLWFVADGSADKAAKLGVFEVAMKLEGMAILGSEAVGTRAVVRLLLTYDNDAHATHIPSRFQTVSLIRDAARGRDDR